MSAHTKEELERKHAPSVSSQEYRISTVGDVAKMRIWRKLDSHILPPVVLLYLLSFLDRTNIGNARVAGMGTDLHLIGFRFNIAAAVFFIPYCVVEVPATILLGIFRPSRWRPYSSAFTTLQRVTAFLILSTQVPSLMLAWGTVTTLTCLVKSYRSLVIVRAFLGLAEGGVFPGVTYYVSLWYPRQMLAKRVSFFTSASAIAGAFSGILTYGIEHLDRKGGLRGWQWIFFIEGLVTIVVALCAYFFVHDHPETARFLTEDEKRFIVQTLMDDSKGQANSHFSTASVLQVLADWKTYVHSLNFMCIAITVYAIALFTPTIVYELGFSAANAQLLSAPPFVCGSVLSLVAGIYSDKTNLRGPFIVAGVVVSLVGYIIAYTTSTPGPGYVAAVIAASGSIPLLPIALVWAGGNSGGNMKRGVVLAMIIGLGNLGGICSSFIYYQPPRFHKGHGTVMGCLGTSIVCSCVLMWTYKRLNKEKEEQCVREGINESMKGMYRDHTDQSPLFRYVI
ncbi:MFS general substrate transporter [Lactarius vividus]|nr:MFS general substrate transporter [Lactarius vividus]